MNLICLNWILFLIFLVIYHGQLALSDSSTMVAFGMYNNKILMWDWSTNVSSYTFGSNSKSSYAIFLKDGRLAGQTNVSTVNIWNVTSGNVDLTLICTAYAVEEMYNGWLATGGADSTLKVWNISSNGTLVKSFSTSSVLTFIKQLKTCNFLVTGDAVGRLRVYNPTNNFTLYNTLNGHSNAIFIIQELPNGNIISCSKDFTVKVWNVTNSTYLSTINPFSNEIYALKMISLDTLVLGGWKNLIYVYKLNNANQLVLNTTVSIASTATMVYDLQVTNTNLVIVSFDDYTIRLYNRTNMALIKSYTIGTSKTGSVIYFAVSKSYSFNITSSEINFLTPNTTNITTTTTTVTSSSQSATITSSTQLTTTTTIISPVISNTSNVLNPDWHLFRVLVGYSMAPTYVLQSSIRTNDRLRCLFICAGDISCKAVTYDAYNNCTTFIAYPPSNGEPLIRLADTNIYYKF